MSFISGDGVLRGPAKPPVESPEMAANAARKLKIAREARAQRKAEGVVFEPQALPMTEAVAVAVETEPEVIEQASEPTGEGKRLPWATGEDTKPLSFDALPMDEGRLPDESKWPVLNGQRVSPKFYARKMADAKEDEATAAGEIHAGTPKLDYQGHAGSDAEYDAAKLAYENATAHLRALNAERAGMTGRIQDAIAGNAFDAIPALKARAGELPGEILTASFGQTQAEVKFAQMDAARERVAKQEARIAGYNATARLREVEAETLAIQYAVIDAENRSDDAVRRLGAAMRRQDALKEQALSEAIGPQNHRAPVGMVEYGHDSGSGMGPMPRPGGF